MSNEEDALLKYQQRDYTTIKDDRKRLSSTSSQETTVECETYSIFTHTHWYSFFNNYSTSIYLENKGSVARDHLANERTYLAWLRTSLSTISVGIGLTQLFRLEKSITNDPDAQKTYINGQMIGLLFIFISILFLFFAFIRFFHTQVAMMKGYFPASRSTILISTCTLLLTMTFILIIITRQ